MSFDLKRRQNNLKQMQAAANFLTKKGYDLDNLPTVQHHHPPIIPQRQPELAKRTETEQDDEESEDNFMMMQYLKDKRNRVNNQRESQSQSNINRNNLVVNYKKQNTSREIDWAKYQYCEADGDGRAYQQRQKSCKNQEWNRPLQKAPSRLNYRQQNQAQNYTIITDQYKKDKVKIEDVFGKREPLRINYKRADVREWENYKKKQDFRLEYVLRRLPNIKQFKNNQKAIIKCALENTNIFVCMPTGGGKSLTFQVLTFLDKGIYICVMPLISLIFDQQMQAKKMGIDAYSMTANTSQSELKLIYQKLNYSRQSQNSIVIFCTPEKLNLSQHFSDILEIIYQRGELKRIVIDEVHCVSSWGKDFRIEYENLSTLKKRFPKTPILALTATVTEVVKQDIISKLGIEGCFFFQSSFNRPNLYYEVRNKDKNILQQIQKIIQRYKNKAGLIYCLSKKDCEETCFKLIKKGYKTAYYHADIQEEEKKRIQERWMNNQTNIIVATIAFGMGINKPDVRFVIHHTMSKSLENYYQESGRAGRDGEFSECIIFYRKQDKQFLQSMNLKNQFSTLARKEFTTKQLAEMIKYCEDRSTCRRKFQLDYLGQADFDPKVCSKTCDNCKNNQIFKEYECIAQGKALVKALLQLQKANISLSRNQLIGLIRCKGEKSLKYKMSQIQRISIDLQSLKTAFFAWKSNELESLIVDLMSYEILQQRVFKSLIMRNNKKNEVVNVYIKCDVPKCRVFLNRVQTLPFRRTIQREAVQDETKNVFSSWQDEFGFEDKQNGEMSSNNSQSHDNQKKLITSETDQTNKFELYQKLLQQIYEGEDDSPQ